MSRSRPPTGRPDSRRRHDPPDAHEPRRPSGGGRAARRDGLPAPVDSVGFARAGRQLDGTTTLAQLPRLAEAGVLHMSPLTWSVRGERARDELDRLREFIHVDVAFDAQVTCVRCLEPVDTGPLRGHGVLRLAATEEQARVEDRDSGDVDVIAADPALDLADLIEDEALLALPMAPVHPHCTMDPAGTDPDDDGPEG